MHELGVTFHIMDHLEKVAKENEVEKIRKVVLELGEVSTVIESYLLNCWTWAAKKRPLFEQRRKPPRRLCCRRPKLRARTPILRYLSPIPQLTFLG